MSSPAGNEVRLSVRLLSYKWVARNLCALVVGGSYNLDRYFHFGLHRIRRIDGKLRMRFSIMMVRDLPYSYIAEKGFVFSLYMFGMNYVIEYV
jgi:hypothetical protein